MSFMPSNMLSRCLAAAPIDRYDVVGALMGYINADPYFRTDDFREAINYALSHGISKEELFDETLNDELEIDENKAAWTEDYYSLARVYLKKNFCADRIRHIEAVGRYIGGRISPVSALARGESVDMRKSASSESAAKANSNGGQKSTGKKPEARQSQRKDAAGRATGRPHRQRETSQTSAAALIILIAIIAAIIVVMILVNTAAKNGGANLIPMYINAAIQRI